MIILLKGLSVFLLAYWPVLAVVSVMMFGAPGATNDKARVRNVILQLYYPLLIAGMYWLNGSSLFGISGKKLFLLNAVVVSLGIYALGYFHLAGNLLRGINNEGYSVVGDKAYYHAKLIEGVDTQSFQPAEGETGILLQSGYYLDQHRVYFRGIAIPGLDPRSFRQMDVPNPYGRSGEYWRDDQVVVHGGQILEGSDPGDVEILHVNYVRSGNNIYYNDHRLSGADVATFAVITDVLAKDQSRIYYGQNAILPGADAASFQLADPRQSTDIAVDKEYVYFIPTAAGSRMLESVDGETLEILDEGTYVKDKHAVYHLTGRDIVRIPDADPTSFRTVRYSEQTPWHATDGVHFWRNGQLIR